MFLALIRRRFLPYKGLHTRTAVARALTLALAMLSWLKFTAIGWRLAKLPGKKRLLSDKKGAKLCVGWLYTDLWAISSEVTWVAVDMLWTVRRRWRPQTITVHSGGDGPSSLYLTHPSSKTYHQTEISTQNHNVSQTIRSTIAKMRFYLYSKTVYSLAGHTAPVMLSPWGQAGFEVKILSSASDSASSICPRPVLELFILASKKSVMMELVIIVSLQWLSTEVIDLLALCY